MRRQIIVIILAVFLIIPSVTFASWWNPFSWNLSSYVSELVRSFFEENYAENNISTGATQPNVSGEGPCVGIFYEKEYIGDLWESFSSDFSQVYNDIYQGTNGLVSQSERIRIINDLKKLESNLKQKDNYVFKYLDEDSWSEVKSNQLKATLLLKDWYVKTERPWFNTDDVMSEQEVARLDEYDLAVEQALAYSDKAWDLYSENYELATDLFNECEEKRMGLR